MDWSIYSNYRLIYKLDGVHRLIHSWDRRTVDVHGNSEERVENLPRRQIRPFFRFRGFAIMSKSLQVVLDET